MQHTTSLRSDDLALMRPVLLRPTRARAPLWYPEPSKAGIALAEKWPAGRPASQTRQPRPAARACDTPPPRTLPLCNVLCGKGDGSRTTTPGSTASSLIRTFLVPVRHKS